MNITLIKHRIQTIRERNARRRDVLTRRLPRGVRTKKQRRLILLQSEELSGYRRLSGAKFLSIPRWLQRVYRTILSGLISLTIGTISLASASAAKAKTAVVQKERKPKGSASRTVSTTSQASVTVLANPAALRVADGGGEPELDTQARYTRIEHADRSVTYNFK